MNVGSVFGKDYSACVQGDVRAISGAGVAWRGKGSLPIMVGMRIRANL